MVAQDGTRLSDEMFSRFIISWSVVGLTCKSSAARFCTPPHDCRARMMICRSYWLTASLNEMPFAGSTGGRRPEAAVVGSRRVAPGRAHLDRVDPLGLRPQPPRRKPCRASAPRRPATDAVVKSCQIPCACSLWRVDRPLLRSRADPAELQSDVAIFVPERV